MKRFILEGALALLLFGLYPQTAKAQRAVHSEEDTKTSPTLVTKQKSIKERAWTVSSYQIPILDRPGKGYIPVLKCEGNVKAISDYSNDKTDHSHAVNTALDHENRDEAVRKQSDRSLYDE